MPHFVSEINLPKRDIPVTLTFSSRFSYVKVISKTAKILL